MTRRRYATLPDGRKVAFTVERSSIVADQPIERGVYIGTIGGLSGSRPTFSLWVVDSTGTRVAHTDYIRGTKHGEPDVVTLRAVLVAAGKILRDVDPQPGEPNNIVASYHGELAA